MGKDIILKNSKFLFRNMPYASIKIVESVLCKVDFPNSSHQYFLQGWFLSVQFISVAQSCPTLCNPMDYSTPGLPVHHQLPEFTHTHVH